MTKVFVKVTNVVFAVQQERENKRERGKEREGGREGRREGGRKRVGEERKESD